MHKAHLATAEATESGGTRNAISACIYVIILFMISMAQLSLVPGHLPDSFSPLPINSVKSPIIFFNSFFLFVCFGYPEKSLTAWDHELFLTIKR